MAVEVASAYVTLLPSMKGFEGRLSKTLKSPMGRIADDAGKTFGSRFGDSVKKWGKVAMVGVGAAITGAFGVALKKGFQRLSAIEEAEAKLRGLGHNANSVSKIMESALASVKGTAYGLDEAATIAAGAVAAGVKSGKELTDYLSLTADAATIAGVSLKEMGPIFNRVQTQGRAYTMELNMLADRGLPIFQWLQEEYGVTAEELRKMVSSGKVDAETYFKVIRDNIGGAALESGKTTMGSLRNLMAALSRFGAAMLSGVYPYLQPLFTSLIDWVDQATTWVVPFLERFHKGIAGIVTLLKDGDFTSGLREAFGWEEDSGPVAFLLKIRQGFTGLLALFREGNFTEALREAFGWEEDSGIVRVLLWIRNEGIPALQRLGGWLAENRTLFLSMAAGAAAAFGALKGIPKVLGLIRSAFLLLSKVFTASPIGMVTIAIGALVGALIYLYNTNETVREAITTAWNWIRDTLSDVWENTIQPALKGFWSWLTESLIPAIQQFWNDTAKPAFESAGRIIQGAWEDVIQPALAAFWRFITEDLAPNLLWFWQEVILPVWDNVSKIISSAWENVIQPAIRAFWSILETVAKFIQTFVAPVLLWLWEHVVRPVMGWIADRVKWAWETFIRPAFSALSSFLTDTLFPAFNTFWTTVKKVMDNIREKIDNVWENFVKPAFDAIKSGVGAVKDAFETAKRGIESAWNKLKQIVAKPIVAVINFVNDGIIDGINTVLGWVGIDGIKKIPIPHALKYAAMGWEANAHGAKNAVAKARGGVLPGWSPGKDNYYFYGSEFDLALAGGEAIMRPEFTRAVGTGWIEAMNAAARMGGVAGVRKALGFSRGGVVPSGGKGGGIGDFLADVGKGIVEFAKDPIGFLKNLALRGLEKIGVKSFMDIASKFVGKVIGQVKDKVWGLIFGDDDQTADVAAGKSHIRGKGLPWQTLWAMIKARVPEAILTSAYRPGAITASGWPSYHGKGRAVDFVAPDMMSAFLRIRNLLPWSELYYTPAGRLQMRNGAPHVPKGITARNHYDHIHAAFARGGIFGWRPTLYDRGGYLPPGLSLVANKSGKPEPVLTDEQWERMQADRGETVINVYGVPMDVSGEVAAEILYHTKRASAGKYARRR